MMNRNEKLADAKTYSVQRCAWQKKKKKKKKEKEEDEMGSQVGMKEGEEDSDFSAGGILKPVWALWNLEK